MTGAPQNGAPKSDRVRLRRRHDRGHYDKDTLYAVLDAGFVAHVGYLVDGAPFVTPTLYWREDNHVYWHGSAASRMLRKAEAMPVCVTVTHIDGMVLARSGFHHSANYRSAMLLGDAFIVTDPDEKAAKLDRFIDGLFPGRVAEIRPSTAQELKATTVLGLEIDEASAKIRDAGVKDDEEDYALPVWSGVVPLATTIGTPEPDERLAPGTPLPSHVAAFAERLKGTG